AIVGASSILWLAWPTTADSTLAPHRSLAFEIKNQIGISDMRCKFFGFALLLASFTSVATAEGRDAEQLFNSYCFACHGTGWDNAPVQGDGFAWEDRLSKGFDTLLENTINGFNT